MSFLRRVAPAWALIVLSPLVAEYLLGDFPLRKIALLVPFMAMYGCGALLIREVVRRASGGWPMLLVLALGYGLLEEGIFTMSLFNNDYVGQHLLTYGLIHALGTSPVWATYVLTLHVVWSISTPVAIAEGLGGARARTPWLKLPGLIIVAVLFVLGATAATLTQIGSSHFVAEPGQLAAVVVVVLVLIGIAAVIARRAAARAASGNVPSATVRPVPAVAVVGVGLVGAVGFQLVERVLQPPLPAAVSTLIMLAIEAAVVVVVALWTRRGAFGARGVAELAIGSTVSYAIFGVQRIATGQAISATGPSDVAGQVVLSVLLIGVAVFAAVRASGASTAAVASGDHHRPDRHALSSGSSADV